ncbi:MAG: Lrp/AsnC family transcriptional regulator [Pseudomonadota bacterium]
MDLDAIDKKIIGILQGDATLSIQDVADKVGLTTNPCWRRIRKLEAERVIKGRVAVIDPTALGLKMTAFVRIHTQEHTKVWVDQFKKAVQRLPEVVECHRMTGEVDYLLKIMVRDLEHYDDVYQRLIAYAPHLSDVSSSFSMEQLKAVDFSVLA